MTPDQLAQAAVDRVLDRTLGRFASRSSLTIEEAAQVYGLSHRSAYEAARRGELPAIRIGGRWVCPVPAIAAHLLGINNGAGEKSGAIVELARRHDHSEPCQQRNTT